MMTRQYINTSLISCVVALIVAMAEVNAAPVNTEIIDRGKYLVTVSGCNDCHTPGYMTSEGKTPEELWLTGDSFGWRGPWGTTYATNLRMRLMDLTEDEWVYYAKHLVGRPPMPWFNLNQMNEEDLRAIYKFIRHLGPAGVKAPSYLTPDKEPSTPYALFPSPPEQE
jgi:mono/diheme cytochrome c family protein